MRLAPRIVRILRAVLVAATLGAFTSAAQAIDTHRPDDLVVATDAMRGWLRDAGLASTFEFKSLQWAPNADPQKSPWLRLDLRFRGQSDTQDAESARFVAALDAYQRANGRSLADALFFTLVHRAGIQHAEARVSVSVFEDAYVVMRDGDSGALVFTPVLHRQFRKSVAVPGLAELAAGPRSQATLGKGADLDALQTRIERFFRDYFEGLNRQARLAPPQVTTRPREPYYIGVDVSGIRRAVIPASAYWESLNISIDLHPTADAVVVSCVIDGEYAAGIPPALPAPGAYVDMKRNYQADLERFTDQLLAALQRSLMGSP